MPIVPKIEKTKNGARFKAWIDFFFPCTLVRVVNHLPLIVKGKILTDGELIYSITD